MTQSKPIKISTPGMAPPAPARPAAPAGGGAPPKAPRPAGSRPAGSRRKGLLIAGGVALVVVVVAVIATRGGSSSVRQPSRAELTSVSHYCDNALQIDAATTHGAGSSPGVFDGPASAVQEAAKGLLPSLDELVKSAPDDVKGETQTMAAAIRAAAGGDFTALHSQSYKTAYQKSMAFRTRSCSAGGDTSGEG